MFRIVNTHSIPYIHQGSVDGIEKHVCIGITMEIYPFPFQNTPKCFGKVQV
ncbi:hypothetical protein IX307_002234 [Bacteroides pyogenes]|nr:hypothetical protein [Bacteroides pyogenes]MBR8787897.1 hypothetical protein [Bacteroides pyogenes]MBR8792463.1 hypothetical protein [Bacteroides pyogenes]